MSLAEIYDAIPHREPFLLVDEIIARGEKQITCRKTFHGTEYFFAGHYPHFPIVPGVLLCEAVFQTGALYMARSMAGQGAPAGGVPLLAKISDVRFRNPVFPGETITIEVKKKEVLGGFTMMRGSIKSGDKRVLNVDFSVAWKVPGANPPA